ncbi:MAG: hypothetical protein Q4D33_10195 [Prevotellaceae bacterium]|nr:hypothetical protein [Prevotellaceae bacterium]
MLNNISALLEKTNNIKRSSYVWNAINAMLSACQCPVIMMVIMRTNGVKDAGVFSIAFAVASLMLYVGLYGLRRYQASDVLGKYTFRQYHAMRWISCGVMIMASGAYCIYGMVFNDYSWTKFLVVFVVCMLKLIQAYSDVVHGRMQQQGRLDVATKCSSVRYVAEVLSYCAMLALTHDLLLSSVVCLAVSIGVLALTTMNAGRRYCDYKPEFIGSKVKFLSLEGFPLFLSLFLNMYISNAPKYAIDAYLTDEIQAIYTIIFMPAFMVGLLANFIFNPILTSYAQLWQSREYKKIKKMCRLIRRQCLAVLGITVLGLAVAYTIGIPLLSIIFGTDLGDYREELCLVMLGGGMLAYSTFFSTVVTIIRRQAAMSLCYAAAAVLSKVMAGILVVRYDIVGAVALYGIVMTMLSIMLGGLMIYGIVKDLKAVKSIDCNA